MRTFEQLSHRNTEADLLLPPLPFLRSFISSSRISPSSSGLPDARMLTCAGSDWGLSSEDAGVAGEDENENGGGVDESEFVRWSNSLGGTEL